MRKKLLSMVMAGTLALSFTACGGSSSGETEKSTDTSKVEETSSGDTQAVSADSGNKKTITVWVEKILKLIIQRQKSQLMHHAAQDQHRKSIKRLLM